MPFTKPSNPQYLVAQQFTVIPGVTTVAPLFTEDIPASSALILPLAGNTNATPVMVDFLNPPVTQGGLTLPATPEGRYYNLAKLNIKAANTTDGVSVIWFY